MNRAPNIAHMTILMLPYGNYSPDYLVIVFANTFQ